MQKTSFPDIALDCLYVDNAAMKMVSDPKSFDVILTENMFGDILSDVSGVINGSIGLLPSASFGSGKSLFEPIHGSFPQGAGKDIANPVATILSAAMMLEDAFGMKPEADAVRAACDDAVGNGICTPDIIPGSSHGTSAVGSYIASRVSAA